MRPRGSSILEAIIASSILIIGLVGVAQLLTQGALNQRRGSQPVTNLLDAQQSLAEYTMFGYAGLTAGVFDGGTLTDVSGRTYTRIVTVDPDAGVGYPAYLITVRIEASQPGLSAPVVTTARTIISQSPDGG